MSLMQNIFYTMRIKDWYTENYPTDDLGFEINPSATFEGLFKELDRYRDVYRYIGVSDSVIRERVFEKLAEVMECDYDYIYDQWALA